MSIFKKEKKLEKGESTLGGEVFKSTPDSSAPLMSEEEAEGQAEAIDSERINDGEKDDSEIEQEENFEDEEMVSSPEQETTPLTEQHLWAGLGRLVRRLHDAEQQLIQKRVWWKSETNMTGLMTENELLEVADSLKPQITEIGNLLILKYQIEDNKVNEKIKEFSSGVKVYDYWTIEDKARKTLE